MSMRVTLYSKPGCHLCDDAVAVLKQIQRRHPHTLEIVDISNDAQLMQLYAERIPVLDVDGGIYAAPLDRAVIERALAEATNHQ